MATRQVKLCDVFGSSKGVESYEIIVQRVLNADELLGADELYDAEKTVKVDLCPRAKKRFDKFLCTATSSPPHREKSEEKKTAAATKNK